MRNYISYCEGMSMKVVHRAASVHVHVSGTLSGRHVSHRWVFDSKTGLLTNDPKFPITLATIKAPAALSTVMMFLSQRFEKYYGKPEFHQHLRVV